MSLDSVVNVNNVNNVNNINNVSNVNNVNNVNYKSVKSALLAHHLRLVLGLVYCCSKEISNAIQKKYSMLFKRNI